MRVCSIFLCLLIPAALWAERLTIAGAAAFEEGARFAGVEISDNQELRLLSFADKNLALRNPAISKGISLSKAQSITDGDTLTEWNFGGDPEVLGNDIVIDLRSNRIVQSVRIIPGGKLGNERPDWFIKGYRIDAAAEERPGDWQVVAQRLSNNERFVDTTLDGSWFEFNNGTPVAVLARFVRITVTRQDLPNRLVIGDVEIYGTGFEASGEYLSGTIDLENETNLGLIAWRAQLPKGTEIFLDVRVRTPSGIWPVWADAFTLALSDSAAYLVPPAEPASMLRVSRPLPNLRSIRFTHVGTIRAELRFSFDRAIGRGSGPSQSRTCRPARSTELRSRYRCVCRGLWG